MTVQQLQQLLDLQRALIDIVAGDGELELRLEATCGLFEAVVPGTAWSVMRLVAPDRLMFICAPGVPVALRRGLDDAHPDAEGGSCAHAAWSGEAAFVVDVETDPRWASVRNVAKQAGIRSCWSAPVRDRARQLVGTFALISSEERLPNDFHRQLMDLGASVVGLLFDQQRDRDRRLQDESQLRQLALVTRQMPNAVSITDLEGRISWVNEAMRQRCACADEALFGQLRSRLLTGELTDPHVLDGMHRAIAAGRDFAGTLVNHGPDGTPYTVQLTCTPLIDAAGICEGAVILEVDVTAHNRLAQFNALLADVSETVASHDDPVALMRMVCEKAVRHADLRLAWVGRPGADGWFEYLAAAGPGLSYLDGLRVSVDPALREGRGSGGRTWREGSEYYVQSFADMAFLKPWKKAALDHGFGALAALPIHRGGRMWAVFTVYHHQENVFDADLRIVLEALASNISRGLDRIDLIRRERANQALNESMLDSATVGMILLHKRVIVRANQRAARLFGFPDAGALVGTDCASLYATPGEGMAIPERITQAFQQSGRAVFETRMRQRDGREIWLRMDGAPFEQEGFDQIWSLVDITEQRAAVQSQELMAHALASVQEGVLITDQRRVTVYINRAFEQLTGYAFDEMLGRSCALLQGPETDRSVQERLRACLNAGEPFKGQLLNYRKDGSTFWNLLTITPLHDASGTLTHFVGVQRDVSDVIALNARLEYLAFHDDLTELPNRRSLDRHLTAVLEQALADDTVIALGKLDLDDFKVINDRYGAGAGDDLLRQLKTRLQACLHPGDFLARTGGDEFALVFAGLRKPFEADQLDARLDALGRAFSEPQQLKPGCRVEIAPSMGLALYPRDAVEPGMLMRMAEEALLQAKRNKFQRVRWWNLHGADTGTDTNTEHALDPYGGEAAQLLDKCRAHLDAVLEGFIDGFYERVADEPYARSIVECLDASEMDNLRRSQSGHLRLLAGSHTTQAKLVAASEKIGCTHALVGLDSAYLLRWMAVYRQQLGAHFNAQPMSARQRYRLVQLIERRLQDDIQAQLDAQAQTLAPYAAMAMRAMPALGASWAAIASTEIVQLATMPGIAGALLLRQSSEGVFRVEASAGPLATDALDVFLVGGVVESASRIAPPGDSLLVSAWQTGVIQQRSSFHRASDAGRSDVAESPRQHELRAAAHVPVLDGEGVPVALLILLGGHPHQFASAFMRQFTRNLQQRWSEIWRLSSRPPPVVPQELAAAYRERLFNGGLQMHMQPVIDLRDGRLVKVEALARLQMEDGQPLAPGTFLPLLRQHELDRLFRLGLDHALEALVDWDAQGLSIEVAINLPPQTLSDPACTQWVTDALTRYGVAPHRLTLEMLETQLVDEAARDEGVQRLLALGVKLAMDDLGSGYGSLRRLASLPFSSIKVDQDLLKHIRTEPAQTISLISAVIQMGRDFGCDVVVEGLEEPGRIEVARVLGARLGQGFGIAQPMPASDLVDWSRGFSLAGQDRPLHTVLGALAFQWTSIRHSTMHGSELEACPMTAVLEQLGQDSGLAGQLHECVHREPDNQAAARDLFDCLESLVRGEGPLPPPL